MKRITKLILFMLLAIILVSGEVLPTQKSEALSVATVSGLKNEDSTSSSIKISWNKGKNVSGYEIRRSSKKSGTYSTIKTITNSSTTSYTNTKLSSGKTYYYKVRAYKTSNGKKYFGKYSSILTTSTDPSKVKNLKTSSKTSSSIKLKWDKVSNSSGYAVYRATSKSGTYLKIATVKDGSTTYYTNSKLGSNKKYYYKVRAYRSISGKNYYGSYSDILSTSTTNSAMAAYKKFLENNKYVDGEQIKYFATLDINNDGVKELLILDETDRQVYVYTYDNGSVKYCGDSYDRGIAYIDGSGRLARIFSNSELYMYYYLTLNSNNKLSMVSYTYNKIDNKYYKETGLVYGNWSKKVISKSEYDKAAKKADFSKYINKHKNTGSNRTKYLK